MFALYMREIGEDLTATGEGFFIGEECIWGVLFADDIVLIS